MKNLKLPTLLMFMLSGNVSAEDPTPHQAFSLNGAGQTAQVRLLSPERKVDVTVVNRKKLQLPNSVRITLKDEKGAERELELSSIGPTSKELGHYQGELPQNQESYVGVKLEIPIKGKKSYYLHSQPSASPKK